jgi:hypothetical protein
VSTVPARVYTPATITPLTSRHCHTPRPSCLCPSVPTLSTHHATYTDGTDHNLVYETSPVLTACPRNITFLPTYAKNWTSLMTSGNPPNHLSVRPTVVPHRSSPSVTEPRTCDLSPIISLSSPTRSRCSPQQAHISPVHHPKRTPILMSPTRLRSPPTAARATVFVRAPSAVEPVVVRV